MSETQKKYVLKGIELMSFVMSEKAENFNEKKPVRINFTQEQKINQAENIVFKYTTIEILDSEDTNVLIKLKVACSFFFLNFADVVNHNEKGEAVILHDVNMDLARICVGTARGILYTQLKGTYLKSAILPLLPFE
ncbi:hypothetical protein DVR12_00820 [Chitinophaga silvatica]|uniref:Preprotein translocase subunit SecB n=1 Tax=Chitinophaga silvatica TaxID=2282649 RepID=A0A3E1YG31_9BACT|nr:hypothetical protein [Chitinophaga silvatica]RFS26363.1 hypothetical protein DVR12_00820 [Chitinophaga silvatica]